MIKWMCMVVISSFITACICTPHLVVKELYQDKLYEVGYRFEAIAGSNLTLFCILEEKQGLDDVVIWGRRSSLLRFDNEADLIQLAELNHIELLNLQARYAPRATDVATKKFRPITLADRGLHFCMNLAHKLFKIVRIKVTEPALECKPNQFKCDDGKKCIDKQRVCDQIYDCPDSSDEEWPVCKKLDVHQCAEGSFICGEDCVPTKWCCDMRVDSDCFVTVRHFCCPPLPTVAVSDDNSLENGNDSTNKNITARKDYAHNIILGIASSVVVITVCLVVFYGIVEYRSNRTTHNSSNQNGIPVTSTVGTDANDNSMILSSLMNTAHHLSTSMDYLDLPPTYADSTRNSPQSSCRSSLEDLSSEIVINDMSPPTYDEALANLQSNAVSVPISSQISPTYNTYDIPSVVLHRASSTEDNL